MFKDFPPEILKVISKKHCVITGRRERKLREQPQVVSKCKPKKVDCMIAETLCMQELRITLNEPTSNKQRKKNPSIRVNGEKVIDSDIEEKKEAKISANSSANSKP